MGLINNGLDIFFSVKCGHALKVDLHIASPSDLITVSSLRHYVGFILETFLYTLLHFEMYLYCFFVSWPEF